MTSTALYFRWLRHEPTGRATIILWTNRHAQLLTAPPDDRSGAYVFATHRTRGTQHPWIDLTDGARMLPQESVLQWTLYEWIYLRTHLTTQVELTDDEMHYWVCTMWQAQAPHRIPYTMVVRERQDTRMWGQPYSTRHDGEVRVCCWFDGPWTSSWDTTQIPTVELPPNPTQKSRHVDDPRVETLPSDGTQLHVPRPRFQRRHH